MTVSQSITKRMQLANVRMSDCNDHKSFVRRIGFDYSQGEEVEK